MDTLFRIAFAFIVAAILLVAVGNITNDMVVAVSGNIVGCIPTVFGVIVLVLIGKRLL